MGVTALLDVLDKKRGVVLRQTLDPDVSIQSASPAPSEAALSYLLIGLTIHSHHFVEALDLRRLSGRGALDGVAGHEGSHGASELLRGGNGGERRALELAITLFEDGEGGEKTGERGLVQSPRSKLRADRPQSGGAKHRNHGGDKICEVEFQSIKSESAGSADRSWRGGGGLEADVHEGPRESQLGLK